MDSLNLIFLVLSFAFFLGGFWFMFRLKVCRSIKGVKYKSVSIIIPARNEEDNIEILLDSINSQALQPDEIIVVNDQSTDKTRTISLEKGAVVLDSKELPEGWLGKPWACFQGAKIARGEVLLFLDSDTKINKNGYEKIISTYLHLSSMAKKIAMSISPYHRIKRTYEELSLIFNIIMTGSMNAFTPLINAKPTGLFGPSLIIKKEDYFKAKGHEAVKDKILENVFFASILQENGIKPICFSGRGSLSYRMYPDGILSLIQGWSKAFASGASNTKKITLVNMITWISSGFIISIFTVYSIFFPDFLIIWLIYYILYSAQLFWMMRRIGSFRAFSPLLFPIHLFFFCVVFFLSLYNKKAGRMIRWKSRKIKT